MKTPAKMKVLAPSEKGLEIPHTSDPSGEMETQRLTKKLTLRLSQGDKYAKSNMIR